MIRKIGKTLQCTHCHETKPLAAFEIRRGGYPQSWCKRCKNAQSAIYKRRSRAAQKKLLKEPAPDCAPRPRDQPPVNTNDETNARLRTMWADKQFKLRMLAARNDGREHFVLGIDRQMGVE